MPHVLRVLSTLSIAATLALSFGCSGGSGGGGTGAGTTGSGSSSSGSASGSSSSGSASSSSGSSGGPIAWPGTWSVHLTYDVDCDFGFGNVKHASQEQTNALTMTDNGQGGLAADVMGYQLGGAGTATALTLSGQYPALDDGNSTADNVQADNNVTLALDTVPDDSHASGTFSGMFVGQFGQKCTIKQGTAAFSR